MSQHLNRLLDIEAAIERTDQAAEVEAARYRPLFQAFRAVREAIPTDLGLTGLAFYREWAERICRAGTELVNAGLSAWLADRSNSGEPTEALAVEIYQLGAEGKKIRNRGAVNAWLRWRLAESLWDHLAPKAEAGIDLPPHSGQGQATCKTSEPAESIKGNGTNPALSERQYNILEALKLLDATGPEDRRCTAEIAAKAEGTRKHTATFKQAVSELARRGLVGTKDGRGGGVWLTTNGHVLIDHIISKRLKKR